MRPAAFRLDDSSASRSWPPRSAPAGRTRVLDRYQFHRTVEEYYRLYCRLTGRSVS